MNPLTNGGFQIGPRLSIISVLGIPFLLAIAMNPDFRQALPRFIKREADWGATVDSVLSNSVLAILIGGAVAVLILTSFLQVVTPVGLIVRGLILLVGVGVLVNIVSIGRIDNYVDTHFFGAEPVAAECLEGLKLDGLGDSIRATLKGDSESPEAQADTTRCEVSP